MDVLHPIVKQGFACIEIRRWQMNSSNTQPPVQGAYEKCFPGGFERLSGFSAPQDRAHCRMKRDLLPAPPRVTSQISSAMTGIYDGNAESANFDPSPSATVVQFFVSNFSPSSRLQRRNVQAGSDSLTTFESFPCQNA